MLQTDTAAKLPRVLEISAACRGHPCTPALAHFQPRHLHQQSPSGLTAGAGTACLPRAPWSTPLFGPSAKGTSSCTSLQPDGCRGSFPEPLSALSGCVSAQPAHSLPLVAACLDVPTSTVGEGGYPLQPHAASGCRGSLPEPLSARSGLRLGAACALAPARRSMPRRADLHGRRRGDPFTPSRGFCRAKVRPARGPALAGRHAVPARSPAMLRLRRYIAGALENPSACWKIY